MEIQLCKNIISKEKSKINIDARSKMFILIIVNFTLILNIDIREEFFLEVSILVLGILLKRYKFIVKMFAVYLIFLLIQFLGGQFLHGTLNIMIVTFSVFIRKILPCGMLGGIIIETTRVNEFMAAMNKIHVSKKIIIPLAVMLRYFPMIKEDWNAIKDAMKMRDISPNIIGFIKKPLLTLECIYVPLMMSASKIADELSAAAITRGIENPKERTCMQEVKFNLSDFICVGYFCGIFILFFIY